MQIREIFEDTEGGFSAKRVAFFVFIFLFVILTLCVVFLGVGKETLDFIKDTLSKIAELLKWIGGFILADKGPAVARALKGAPEPPEK